jgi:DNA-binding response OmpR family regulator
MTRKTEILIWVPTPMLRRVSTVVRECGFNYEKAACLKEALAMLSHQPRVVISTLDNDGLELLRTARRYSHETEVIVLEREEA